MYAVCNDPSKTSSTTNVVDANYPCFKDQVVMIHEQGASVSVFS